jgi:hypothetical protein
MKAILNLDYFENQTHNGYIEIKDRTKLIVNSTNSDVRKFILNQIEQFKVVEPQHDSLEEFLVKFVAYEHKQPRLGYLWILEK